MAPRGRGRPKKRNTRMDAAIEAMTSVNFGFDQALVRATVQELLEIYTEEGWCLIEDNYYNVLLEAILEKLKAVELHQGGETIGQSSAGPSTLPALPPIPDAVDDTLPLDLSVVNHEIDDLPGSERAESQNSRQGAHEDDHGNTQSARPPLSIQFHKPCNGWTSAKCQGGDSTGQSSAVPSTLPALPPIPDAVDDILPLKISVVKHEIDDLPGSEGAESHNSRQGPHGDDPGNTRSAPPPCSRRPYHGWISANEEDDAERDLVDIPPMSIDEFKRRYLKRNRFNPLVQKDLKRKSRWDMKPNS